MQLQTISAADAQAASASDLGMPVIGLLPGQEGQEEPALESQAPMKLEYEPGELVNYEQYVETPLAGIKNKDLPSRFTDRYVWAVENRKMPDVQDRSKRISELYDHARHLMTDAVDNLRGRTDTEQLRDSAGRFIKAAGKSAVDMARTLTGQGITVGERKAAAKDLMQGVKQDFVATLDEIVPFSPVGIMDSKDYAEAARRIMMDEAREQAGIDLRLATDGDYLLVAGLDQGEHTQAVEPFWYYVGSMARGTVKFGTEFGVTSLVAGPAGKAAHSAVFGGFTRLGVRGGIRSLSTKAVRGAVASVARGGLTTMAVEEYYQGLAKGKTSGEAAFEALLSASLEAGSELLGGPMTAALGRSKFAGLLREFIVRQGVTKKKSSLTVQGMRKMANQVGYSNVLGEHLEERALEFARFGLGLDEELSGVSGSISRGEYGQAIKQLAAEFIVFGVPSAVLGLTDMATGGYDFGKKQPSLPTLTKLPPGQDPIAPPVPGPSQPTPGDPAPEPPTTEAPDPETGGELPPDSAPPNPDPPAGPGKVGPASGKAAVDTLSGFVTELRDLFGTGLDKDGRVTAVTGGRDTIGHRTKKVVSYIYDVVIKKSGADWEKTWNYMWGGNIRRAVEAAALLHDVGRKINDDVSDRVQRRNNTNNEIEKYARQAVLGITPKEIELAKALVDDDVLDDLVNNRGPVDRSVDAIRNQAELAGVPVQSFLMLQKELYKAKALADPVKKKLLNDEGKITSLEFAAFEEELYGSPVEIKWSDRITKDAERSKDKEDLGPGTFHHATAVKFEDFDPEQDDWANPVGPGIYLVAKADRDVAKYYITQAVRKVIGVFSKATKAAILALTPQQLLEHASQLDEKAKSSKDPQRHSDAANILRNMANGLIGESVEEVSFSPQETLNMGFIESGKGSLLSDSVVDRILNAVKLLHGMNLQVAGPVRAFELYNVLVSKLGGGAVGRAKLNDALLTAGFDSIQFVHPMGSNLKRFNVLVRLVPSADYKVADPVKAESQALEGFEFDVNDSNRDAVEKIVRRRIAGKEEGPYYEPEKSLRTVFGRGGLNRKDRGDFIDRLEELYFPDLRQDVFREERIKALDAVRYYEASHKYNEAIRDPDKRGYKSRANQELLDWMKHDEEYQKLLSRLKYWNRRGDLLSSKDIKTKKRAEAQKLLDQHVYDYESMQHARADQIPPIIKYMIQQYAESIFTIRNRIFQVSLERVKKMLEAIRRWGDDELGISVRHNLWTHFLGRYDTAENLNTPQPIPKRMLAVWFASSPEDKMLILQEQAKAAMRGERTEFLQDLIGTTRDMLHDETVTYLMLPVLLRDLAKSVGLDWEVPTGMQSLLDQNWVPDDTDSGDDLFVRGQAGKTTDYRGEEIEKNDADMAITNNVLASRAQSISESFLPMLTPVTLPTPNRSYPKSPFSSLGRTMWAPKPTSPIVNAADTMPLKSETDGKAVVTIPEIMDLLEEISRAVAGRLVILQGHHKRFKAKGGKLALAIYNTIMDIARTRASNDLVSIFHEFAHAIDYAMNMGFSSSDYARMAQEKAADAKARGVPYEEGYPKSFWMSLPVPIQVELSNLVPPSYSPHIFIQTVEGFAHWMQKWMLEPDLAASEAPLFTAWAEENLMKNNPKARKLLDKVRKKANAYRIQGSLGRGKAQIYFGQSFWQRWKKILTTLDLGMFIEEAFGKLSKVKMYADFAESLIEKTIPDSLNPYKIMRGLAGTAPGRVRTMIYEGMIDLAGNIVPHIRPLIKITEYVTAESYEDFVLFLYARRAWALARHTRIKEDSDTGQVFSEAQEPRNAGLLTEDIDYIISYLTAKYPGFMRAAEIYDEWWNGLLNYIKSASPGVAEYIEAIVAGDSGFYLPLHRHFREIDKAVHAGYSGNRTAFVNDGIIKRLKGSGQMIKDPFAEMLIQAQSFVELAHWIRARDVVHELSQRPQMGWMMHEVNRDEELKHKAWLSSMFGTFISELTAVPKSKKKHTQQEASDYFDQMVDDMTEAGFKFGLKKDVLINFFALKKFPNSPHPILAFSDPKGKLVFKWVNGDLFRAMTLDPTGPMQLHGFLGKFARFMAKMKTISIFGTTALRPAFNLWNNPAVAFASFMMHNSAGIDAGPLPKRVATNLGTGMYTWIAGLREAFNAKILNARFGMDIPTPWFDVASQLGLEYVSNISSAETDSRSQQAINLIFKRPLKSLVMNPSNWPAAMSRLLLLTAETMQFGEIAGRLAELRIVAKRLGVKPGDKLDLNQSIALMNAFKGVDIDFTYGGHTVLMVNQYVPFFRSPFGSLLAATEAINRDPTMYFTKGFMAMGMAMFYWWLVRDEEWYREAGDIKYGKWILPVGDWKNGEGFAVQFPRPYDMGAVFTTLPEAMMDAWYRKDPQVATAFAWDFMERHLPGFSKSAMYSKEPLLGLAAGPLFEVPVVGPFLEAYSNRSDFTGRPIVPRELENVKVTQQYTRYTSEVAKIASHVLRMAPAKIDHLLEGILGPVSRDAAKSLDWILEGTDDAKLKDTNYEISDMPVIGPLLFSAIFRRGGPMGTTPDSVRQVYAELDRLSVKDRLVEETEENRQMRLQLNDAADAVKALAGLRDYASTPQERRMFTISQGAIARDALAALKAGDDDRSRFTKARKTHEKALKQRKKELQVK